MYFLFNQYKKSFIYIILSPKQKKEIQKCLFNSRNLSIVHGFIPKKDEALHPKKK